MANLSSIREKLHNAESSVEEQKVVTEFSSLAELEGIGFKDEYQSRIQESVDNVIKNSKNLICALEGIGAMYCPTRKLAVFAIRRNTSVFICSVEQISCRST